eukprot:224529-Rhodomonas_salina.2
MDTASGLGVRGRRQLVITGVVAAAAALAVFAPSLLSLLALAARACPCTRGARFLETLLDSAREEAAEAFTSTARPSGRMPSAAIDARVAQR